MKKIMRISVLAFVFLLFAGLIAQVQAQTIYVATSGSHDVANNFDSWARAATNLNEALERANALVRNVQITNGVFGITNTLYLTNGFTLASVNGPAATVIYRDGSLPKFGLFEMRHSNAMISGVTMTNGQVAGSSGGAIIMTDGTLTNCVISRCGTDIGYGGVLAVSGGRMVSCLMTNISQNYPLVVLSGSAVAEDCQMVNCSAGEQGTFRIGGSAVARRCLFARLTGNAAYVSVEGGLLESSLVHGNSASGPYLGPAGGVRITSGRMVNCTVANNQRTGGTGSGVAQTGGTVTNCIIYANGAAAPGDNYSGSISACAYSCAPELTNSTQGNVTGDPRFVNTNQGNYRLRAGSPALDSGTNLASVTTDLAGRARPLSADDRNLLRHDMGAYEKDGLTGALEVGFSGSPLSGFNVVTSTFNAVVAGSNRTVTGWAWDYENDGGYDDQGTSLQSVQHAFDPGRYSILLMGTNTAGEVASVTNLNYVLVVGEDIFVSLSGSNQVPYNTWAKAATNLNDAVDIALTGCRVRITNGSYRVMKKVDMFNDITIKGENGPGVTTVWRSSADTKFGLFDIRSAGAVLMGVTMTNGHVTGSIGSAIYMNAGTVSNCVVRTCYTDTGYAGAVVMDGGLMKGCVISNIIQQYPVVTIQGASVFEDNTVTILGANEWGTFRVAGSAVVRRCQLSRFSGQTAFVLVSAGAMENCLIYSNQTSVSGDGYFVSSGGASITGGRMVNCTIARNSKLGGSCSGLRHTGGGVTNCIIFGNGTGAFGDNYTGSVSTVAFSCAPELTNSVAGNLTNDPVFVSASNANFRLRRESPCLNKGTNQAWMIGAVDLDGNPRIKQSLVDMGAYELPPALGTILELR